MSKICQYFFAPHSPWSYLGHERFVAIARQHGVQIEVRPFDLNKVFGVSGGLPLAKRAPQRQAYRLTELARWSTFLNVPMNVQPKFFPVSPELAAKLIVATRLAGRRRVAGTVFGHHARPVGRREKHRRRRDAGA